MGGTCPRILERYTEGKIDDIDFLTTRTMPLEYTNDASDPMYRGVSIRSVVDF